MDLRQQIIDATVEIFTTMVMMDITPGDQRDIGSRPIKSSITGMIGLAGTQKGVLAIHIPNEVAMAITSSFLGMDVDEINDDVLDAVGELANMLGGNVKAILSEKGRDIDLSLPSTISGAEYHFQCLAEAEILIIPFSVADGKQFIVEIQLENGGG